MAHRVLKGTLVPGEVPPLEEDEQGRSSHSNVLQLPGPRQQESPLSHPIDLTPTRPNSDPAHVVPLKLGDKVVRKVRPNDIGTIELLVYQADSQIVKEAWVTFYGKAPLPYSPIDLLRLRVH